MGVSKKQFLSIVRVGKFFAGLPRFQPVTFAALLVQLVLLAPLTASAATACAGLPPTADPTLFCEDFNGTALDPANWSIVSDTVVVHDGMADLQINVTDVPAGVSARFKPLKRIRVEVRHKLHLTTVGWPRNFAPGITLGATDPLNGNISVTWPNFDRFQPTDGWCWYKTTVAIRLTGDVCFLVSNLQSSSFFDRWIVSVIDYDTETGLVKLDIGGDGSIDLSGTIPVNKRFPIRTAEFIASGWWTGHTHQLDYVRVSGVLADALAPSVPAGLTSTPVSPGKIELSWMAATDNLAVTTYKIYSDAVLVSVLGNVTRSGPLDLAALGYMVAACDAAGNCSAQSTRVGGSAIIPLNNPIPAAGMAAAGSSHALLLKPDGALLAWGRNDVGQLGDGSALSRTIPVLVGSGFSMVAAGGHHSAAVKADGTLWTWGGNDNGQLGDGTTTARTSPGMIGSGFVAVAAGGSHTAAIKADGSLWAWGSNFYGEVGDGTTLQRTSRVQVGTGFRLVAAGAGHTLAIKTDNSLWAWGQNYPFGSLGDFTTVNRSSPVLVGPGYSSVAAGYTYSMAVKTDGSLWGWGNNWFGNLGNGGSGIEHNDPVQVGTGYAAVSAAGHTLGLKKDGSLWVWGRVHDTATTATNVTIPERLGAGFAAISAGSAFSVALKTDGSVWSWGINPYGQLGDGTFATRASPGLVVNEIANGFLNLLPKQAFEVPPSAVVPFFVTSSGDVAAKVISLSSSITFNPADADKRGSVFVTAMVPAGSLVAAQSAGRARSAATISANAASPNSCVLVQLVGQQTSDGGVTWNWADVENSRLNQYVGGVFRDLSGMQNLLVKLDTDKTNMSGAKFCVGYGTNADQMLAAGTMRLIATIPDPTGTGICSAAPSCLIGGAPVSYDLVIQPGWNLLGNSLNQTLPVASLYGDASVVTAVWKWDAVLGNWQVYAPNMDASALLNDATAQGYGVLTEIKPGEGYWVNAKVQSTRDRQSGASFTLTAAALSPGWNLVATGNQPTPSVLNANLKASLPGTGVTTLWAWDNAQLKWIFYAPSLEAQGGSALADYVNSQNYEDFMASGKTLGQGQGFWVRRP